MAGAKMLLVGFVAGILVLTIQSCSKQPVACFTTSPMLDSIHVNEPVTFNANCSIFAGSYNWQFYDNPDSVAFTPIVTKVFTDTGSVDVYLLVLYNTNYAAVDQTVKVQP